MAYVLYQSQILCCCTEISVNGSQILQLRILLRVIDKNTWQNQLPTPQHCNFSYNLAPQWYIAVSPTIFQSMFKNTFPPSPRLVMRMKVTLYGTWRMPWPSRIPWGSTCHTFSMLGRLVSMRTQGLLLLAEAGDEVLQSTESASLAVSRWCVCVYTCI